MSGEVRTFYPLLSEGDVANQLGVSVFTVQRMRKRGEIKSKKIRGRWKYRQEWLVEYLEKADNQCDAMTSSASGSTSLSVGAGATCGAPAGTTQIHDRQSAHLSAQATFKRRKSASPPS